MLPFMVSHNKRWLRLAAIPPDASPQRHADIKCRDNVAERKAATGYMRWNDADDVTGECGPKDRGYCNQTETRNRWRCQFKTADEAFAQSITDPAQRLRDSPPRRELDESIKQQDHDLEGLHVHLASPVSAGSLP